jgi:hypothetical protein
MEEIVMFLSFALRYFDVIHPARQMNVLTSKVYGRAKWLFSLFDTNSIQIGYTTGDTAPDVSEYSRWRVYREGTQQISGLAAW